MAQAVELAGGDAGDDVGGDHVEHGGGLTAGFAHFFDFVGCLAWNVHARPRSGVRWVSQVVVKRRQKRRRGVGFDDRRLHLAWVLWYKAARSTAIPVLTRRETAMSHAHMMVEAVDATVAVSALVSRRHRKKHTRTDTWSRVP
ncbi:hypothetical protein [Salinicola tamaricis]|uniref:hypothetical protein n=1 Tax=Salinicola tamaricis TaxID=1771309 RepID=UPI001F5CA009|nr:hypothetical protein [Salinicola tamaricis]